MKIDYSNAQIINSPDFCMHDDWFVNMNVAKIQTQ
mgnify:CR=1 FL=1